jgi:hypothetical protein
VTTREAYTAALRTALECLHGVQGGDLVRPWTGTPACPLCRLRHPVTWRYNIVTADTTRGVL